jgi:hypothetical protein
LRGIKTSVETRRKQFDAQKLGSALVPDNIRKSSIFSAFPKDPKKTQVLARGVGNFRKFPQRGARGLFDGQLDLERLVFINESWASTNMARLYARAKKGGTASRRHSSWRLENDDLRRRPSTDGAGRTQCEGKGLLFLLDKNVLIRAHEDDYPIDRVPQFWEWIIEVSIAGHVKIPFEIHGKIAISNGPLKDWICDCDVKSAIILEEEVDSNLVDKVPNGGYGGDLTDSD